MLGRYIVGITGASGSIYGKRVIEELLQRRQEVCLVATDNGSKVFEYEIGIGVDRFLEIMCKEKSSITRYENDNFFAPIASGSYDIDAMVVAPCTMTTIGKMSTGISDTLLTRAADVCLKERRRLVVVPREMPLNSIHLKNMLTLSLENAVILPPIPSFYQHPYTIEDQTDSIVGRILQSIGIENDLYKKWGSIS